MCGIVGSLERVPATPQHTHERLAAGMASTLSHRGPDAGGVWSDERHGVAFGHRRLSVIDLSETGSQPMTSASGRWTITYNGEVYNHPELRRELEGSGSSFRGTSDTEVLVEAIERWGVEETLGRCDGMFAFAAWDAGSEKLVLARDRFGEKPLYYGWFGSTFLFASELRALRAHPEFRAEPDLGAVRGLIEYGYVPTPMSIYQEVRKLEPGCLLEVYSGGAPGSEVVRRWWDPYESATVAAAVPFGGSPDEAADILESLIRQSVDRRMVADVPVGAFLSGGIDSSTVVAIASRVVPGPVHTYSIGFDRREYDESRHAEQVARHLDTVHRSQVVSEADALSVIPRLPDLWDEPFADSSQIPTFLVAELARREVTVALSGDGGDELFGGYDRYRLYGRLALAERVSSVPVVGPLVRAGVEASSRTASALRRDRVANRLQKLGRVLGSHDRTLLYRDLVMQWPSPPMRGAASTIDPLRRWTDFDDGIAAALAVDTVSYLPDDILVKVDRATMAHSLEGRIPLLTEPIFSFAWSLPAELRWGADGGKAVLKRVLERHVPRHLFDRPKQGFGIPLGRWLRTDLRSWAAELLESAEFSASGFFDVDAVLDAWTRHRAGGIDLGSKLWPVLMFEAWRRRHHPEWTLS